MSDPSGADLQALATPSGESLKARTRPDFVTQATDMISGIREVVLQGFTLGLKDETEASGKASGRYIGNLMQGRDTDFGEAYDLALTEVRQPGKKFREEHPNIALAGEIVGGVFSGGAAVKGVSYLRNIVTGSAFGGVAGAGFSEGDLAERGMAAALGAGIGGGLTAVLGPIIRGVGALGQRALTKSERTALNSTLRAFERDGIPIGEAMTRLRQWQSQGAKPEILADLGGDNVRGLLRGAVSTPSGARTVAQATLRPRQLDQGARVFSDALDALAPGANTRAAARSLATARAAASDPLYELARGVPLRLKGTQYGIDDLLEILRRPSMVKAVKEAVTQAKDVGKVMPQIIDAKGNITQIPDLEMLDWIKRQGLDSIIEGYRDSTTQRLNMSDPKVRTLLQLKNEFLAVVDDLAPVYRQAREAFAGPSELLNALDFGKRFLADFRKDPFITEDTFTRMTTGEKEYFRIGLAQSIQDIIEKAPDGADAVKRIFGTRRLREAVALAMPDEQALARFERAVERESNMFRTNRIAGIESGSPTARITEEISDMVADIGITPGPVLSALAGEPRPLMGQVLARLGRGTGQALKSDVATAIGQILMAGEPEEIARLLTRLERAAGVKLATGAAETAAAKGAGVSGAELVTGP